MVASELASFVIHPEFFVVRLARQQYQKEYHDRDVAGDVAQDFRQRPDKGVTDDNGESEDDGDIQETDANFCRVG